MSWTESEAAHKLIRRKNAKAQDISRRKARQSKTSRSKKNAEGMEMTPDIMDYPGLPVVPDSYGTNSALTSGQGVPQWYGSAESRFDNLADKIAKQYEKKGMNPQEAREVGKKTAYSIGAAKYGKAGMAAKSRAGRMDAESGDDIRTAADLVAWADSNDGSLPVFSVQSAMADNEHLSMIDSDDDEVDFVFLDGTMATCILDDKTLSTFVVAYESETFEARARYDPSENDALETKEKFQLSFPSFEMSPSSLQYLTFQQGSSNKFHTFWLAQDSSGGWYAFNAYQSLGYSPNIFRITGPTSQEQASRAMQSKMNTKLRKGYTNRSKEFGLRAEFEASGFGDKMTFGRMEWSWETDEEDIDEDRINYLVENAIQEDGAESGSGTLTQDNEEGFSYHIDYTWEHVFSDYNTAETGVHSAEHMITQGLPVIPDSYGTNSALSSGQGVPQWYGSADTEDMDWDRTEYEYKELEIAKPFRTAFMASLGFIVAPLVALSGLAFILGDE